MCVNKLKIDLILIVNFSDDGAVTSHSMSESNLQFDSWFYTEQQQSAFKF